MAGPGDCLSKILASGGIRGRAKRFRKLSPRIVSLEGSDSSGKMANLKSQAWEIPGFGIGSL